MQHTTCYNVCTKVPIICLCSTILDGKNKSFRIYVFTYKCMFMFSSSGKPSWLFKTFNKFMKENVWNACQSLMINFFSQGTCKKGIWKGTRAVCKVHGKEKDKGTEERAGDFRKATTASFWGGRASGSGPTTRCV